MCLFHPSFTKWFWFLILGSDCPSSIIRNCKWKIPFKQVLQMLCSWQDVTPSDLKLLGERIVWLLSEGDCLRWISLLTVHRHLRAVAIRAQGPQPNYTPETVTKGLVIALWIRILWCDLSPQFLFCPFSISCLGIFACVVSPIWAWFLFS